MNLVIVRKCFSIYSSFGVYKTCAGFGFKIKVFFFLGYMLCQLFFQKPTTRLEATCCQREQWGRPEEGQENKIGPTPLTCLTCCMKQIKQGDRWEI